ncbi:MAG: MarR family transcriptional regulator [Planktomarina sp.]|nr:MarR family transcriptional regulator [Planktomarina sp.]|tara:strand:- start:527 stop:979 length:453 start_codon:yes stop_codon:yes gene_type:complete
MPKFLDSLPMILSRTLDGVMPVYRALFQEHAITDQQWRVMRALWEQKHLTSKQISEITLLPSPSLVGILDRLEKKGFVGRLRSVEDRRLVYIVPTQAGRKLQELMLPKIEQIHDRFMHQVTPDEWGELNRILDKLNEYKTTSVIASGNEI